MPLLDLAGAPKSLWGHSDPHTQRRRSLSRSCETAIFIHFFFKAPVGPSGVCSGTLLGPRLALGIPYQPATALGQLRERVASGESGTL
jgi:hypothetical protein